MLHHLRRHGLPSPAQFGACLALTLGVVMPSCAASTDQTLRELEVLRVDAKRGSLSEAAQRKCPDHLHTLIDQPKQRFFESLGAPDFKQLSAATQPEKWSYFFAPESRQASRGGAFPEVTIAFSTSGLAESVTCNYAR